MVHGIILVNSQCPRNCNKNGLCNLWSQCECFSGYESYDCSKRTCPSGPRLSDIAYDTDLAHQYIPCSGQGTCDGLSGLCICKPGYTGATCERTICPNSCSNHGACISLREAAAGYDGWSLNHTTKYSLWDADIIYGCQCDPGWIGYDCSERACDVGSDPRQTSQRHEVVTLSCTCASTCKGLFKIRFMGTVIPKSFAFDATGKDVANAIMNVRLAYADIPAHSFVPVIAYTNTSNSTQSVCQSNTTTRTMLKFRRQAGDVPALSFYQNRVTGGDFHFETTQTLICDCLLFPACNGSFRLSYDGEMSRRIHIFDEDTTIISVLRSMKTVTSSGISFSDDGIGGAVGGSRICIPGSKTNHSIVFRAPAGNLPRLGIWSSAVTGALPDEYDSANATVLTIVTADGRDDHVSPCSGIGRCNRNNGSCICPYGWENDPDVGPCGRPAIPTSDWQGVSRCPGTVSYDEAEGHIDWSARSNDKYLYISIDPSYRIMGVNADNNVSQSVIERYPWVSYTAFQGDPQPFILDDTATRVVNLTSNSSAGPLVIDQSGGWLYYVDNDARNPYIGRMELVNPTNHTRWLSLTCHPTSMAIDAHYDRRKLYWMTAGITDAADGKLYWAYLDAIYPSENDLTSAIGQAYLVDPRGIAIHFYSQRLYWLDKNLSQACTVLRSCDFTGGAYSQVFLYRYTVNVTQPANVTDLKIDFRNNTLYFIDSNYPTAIIKTNLDFPEYLNKTEQFDFNHDHFDVSVRCRVARTHIGSPSQMYMDGENQLLMWTDYETKRVSFFRYAGLVNNSAGDVLVLERQSGWSGSRPKVPMGMVLDNGMGPPRWGNYLECYGKGRCLGATENWRCECFPGFTGDCQSRSCPKGPAWFAEPIVDDIAHDRTVECSNMGKCDSNTGMCLCYKGFEGAACERALYCNEPNATATAICTGNGRCLSMRDLASHAVDTYGDPAPLTYGTTPHNAATWDADVIHGCMGDSYGYIDGYKNVSTYEGLHLEELTCPMGYNARTLDKVYGDNSIQNFTFNREVQQLQCTATNGSFTLKFRGKYTQPIVSNSTLSVLRNRLLDMHRIGEFLLTSSLSLNDHVCNAYGEQYVNITFLTELGQVPLLTVGKLNVTGGAASVTISRIHRSTGTLYECSGHGTCDRKTGRCQCMPRWGSSDGLGATGLRNDCGLNMIY
eukprot:gene2290-4453_t